MNIAVDAMGGDKAPYVNVMGAIEALQQSPDLHVFLTGREEEIKNCLSQLNDHQEGVTIVHAPQVVEPHEKPSEVFRKKKESSIAIGLRLLKEKKVDGFVSAGNTGAVVAFSIFTLGRLPGVSRPALATFFPTESACTLVLDVGATSDTKAINLFQFGIMGSLYFEKTIGKKNPTVGLLSIGEESTKGKEITYEAYSLLEKSKLNFIGNVEGNDILKGKADVIVADGFVGNAILKFGESMVRLIVDSIRSAVKSKFRYKMGGILLRPAIRGLFHKMNYEAYGGAALLGVNGMTIVSHGRSSSRAIANAILIAQKNAAENINTIISDKLKESQ
jgi:glycerol-3-phosphate acyltransferase PlsX